MTIRNLSRRKALARLGAGAALSLLPANTPFIQAQSASPIRIGFLKHATGRGAVYGRWFERTAAAALRLINEAGGINGRPVEIIVEDDGTEPARAAALIEKCAVEHGCDVVFGTLFPDVVLAAAPRAGALKIPYFIVSETHRLASGALNRWTLQPGITDVRAQVTAVAPFLLERLGRKIAFVYSDDAFGRTHRDLVAAVMPEIGGEVIGQVAIPPDETRFAARFSQIPRTAELLYHAFVGSGASAFVSALGAYFDGQGPALFGFIDGFEAVDLAGPGLAFLEGSYFWEGMPRFQQPGRLAYDRFFRAAVGVDENGASLLDPRKVATYAHMFGCWETLWVIKAGMEAARYQSPADRQRLVEAIEAMTDLAESRAHPQGPKRFNGKTHQVFGLHYVSQLRGGRLDLVHTAPIAAGRYPDAIDYTAMPF
ncbi:MAG: ABC transporter substrate-binding protein [Pseudomonadota bacterium]